MTLALKNSHSLEKKPPVAALGMRRHGRCLLAITVFALPMFWATSSAIWAQQYSSQSAELFGIAATGSRFVYVIDKSGSTEGKPLRAAKQELAKSLDKLSRIQQFQIVFYNHRPQVYSAAGQARLFWADNANKQSAKNFVKRIGAGGGTDHMAALSAALRMKPGVIFFFTDADDPQLSAEDLARVNRLSGAAVIHVIEFGKGEQSPGEENFLKRLASQNRGEYRYLDLDEYE